MATSAFKILYLVKASADPCVLPVYIVDRLDGRGDRASARALQPGTATAPTLGCVPQQAAVHRPPAVNLALGVSSAGRSPIAYWIPARKCCAIAACQKMFGL
jgi:hypothetical protein